MVVTVRAVRLEHQLGSGLFDLEICCWLDSCYVQQAILRDGVNDDETTPSVRIATLNASKARRTVEGHARVAANESPRSSESCSCDRPVQDSAIILSL